MTLEQQIATLADLGLHLNKGITIHDLLNEYPREFYEDSTFKGILFVYGDKIQRNSKWRLCCLRVWHFDLECIDGASAYTEILKSLGRISEQAHRLTKIRASVDFDNEKAWLSYTIDGQKRLLRPEVDGDWADIEIINQIMKDIGGANQKFYKINNGQAILLFYLDTKAATKLRQLTDNALEAMNA